MNDAERIEALERQIADMQAEITTLKLRLLAVEARPVNYQWPPIPYPPYEPYVLKKDSGTAADPPGRVLYMPSADRNAHPYK